MWFGNPFHSTSNPLHRRNHMEKFKVKGLNCDIKTRKNNPYKTVITDDPRRISHIFIDKVSKLLSYKLIKLELKKHGVK